MANGEENIRRAVREHDTIGALKYLAEYEDDMKRSGQKPKPREYFGIR